MPRFFFNVADHDLVTDSEGVELPSRDAVKEEAVEEMRELLADGARQGLHRSAWTLIVKDEEGKTVMHLPFKSALKPDVLRSEGRSSYAQADGGEGAGF